MHTYGLRSGGGLKISRALLCALAVTGMTMAVSKVAFAADNPIVIENQKTGTTAWQIGLPGYTLSNDTELFIRGYASATSINKGEKITFFVTVNVFDWQPQPNDRSYNIDVYRIGWYGGAGGRLMQHIGPLTGVSQPACPVDPDTGMISCPWSASYTLDTASNTLNGTPDWTSGIYLALLTGNQQNWDGLYRQSYIIFTVREDSRPSDILFQQAVATYQAYNNYPDDQTTGKSLYDSGSYGPLTTLGTERAVKVSFDRPYTYTDHTGAGDFLRWELYFVRWLERSGYDVTYSTDVDTHVNGAQILNHKAFLSVGHAEYWSKEMRDAVEAARDHGTGLAFFGANAVYSQIRFEPSASGVPNRVIVCYKDALLDPVNNPANTAIYNPSLTTVPFRSSPVLRSEQQLVGVMYDDYFDGEAPAQSYVVQNSGNWVYAGTGFKNNTKVPGILGYELDRQFQEYPFPSAVSGSYTLLSKSPFTGVNVTDFSNSSIYQASNGPGAWVFGAGTIDWSWGLDSYVPPAGVNTHAVSAPNPGIQQTTANILNRFLLVPPAAPTNLTAIGATPKGGKFQIKLAWTDNANDETGFNIERSSDGVNFTQIGTAPANVTTYSDTTVSSGNAYYYRVAAYNAAGASAYSNTAEIGVSSGAPAAPSNLTAKQSGSGNNQKITLSWQDNATNATNYVVDRSTDQVTWTRLPSVLASTATSYVDSSGLQRTTTYYYRVGAINATNASTPSYSNVASTSTK